MNEHQAFEAGWWGDCANTFGEECKQLTYAYRMGLVNVPSGGHWPVYDMAGKGVLDVGGGPASMLLKTTNLGRGVVVDPCPYPGWVRARYAAHGVEWMQLRGEDWRGGGFDEVWVYNVLQHVEDPELVIRNARAAGRILRVFEWIEMPATIGHPHVLRAADLDAWVGATGRVEEVDENGAVGLAWFGTFA